MASTTEIHVYQKQVEKAVEALYKFLSAKENKDLLNSTSTEKINLQFTFQKVPELKNKKIKIPLPHALHNELTDICLFVKDFDKRDREFEKTVEKFQEIFDSNGIKCITKIIPLKELKLEHKPFEAKRNLAQMYDVFLADDRIVRLLPTFLGKAFYGDKKMPIQVNLQAKNLKKEIDGVLNKAYCSISGRGSCTSVTIGNSHLTQEQVVDNVNKSIECLTSNLPGGIANVKNFYLKTETSPALPVYVSTISPNDVTLKKPKSEVENIVAEEFTPLGGDQKVAVDKLSNFVIVKKNQTAHQAFMKQRNAVIKKRDKKLRGERRRVKRGRKIQKKIAARGQQIKQPKPAKKPVGKVEDILPKKRKTVSKLKELKSAKKSVKSKLKKVKASDQPK